MRMGADMSYNYNECGLDNVVIDGLPVCKDHAGKETVLFRPSGSFITL